jgi:hypothetical protein
MKASSSPIAPKKSTVESCHESWSAVVSIRGTLSLEDCLTDFMCEPADLSDWMNSAPSGAAVWNGGDSRGFDEATPDIQLASRGDTVTAHAGILTAAKAVVHDLQVPFFYPLRTLQFMA